MEKNVYKITWAFKRSIKKTYVAFVEAVSDMDARMQFQGKRYLEVSKKHDCAFPLDHKAAIIKGVKNVGKAG